MIGYVRGKVTGIFDDFCFTETGGIGYRIFISGKDRETLHVGDEVRLVTYLCVREDALSLYGFTTEEAHALFMLLISVSKIGPKVAMGILSATTPAAFSHAVMLKDVAALTKLPGIGKKTAEHLILELKDKLGSLVPEETEFSETVSVTEDGAAAEAMAALRSLGYEVAEVSGLVAKLSTQYTDAGALIGAVLREIGRGGNRR